MKAHYQVHADGTSELCVVFSAHETRAVLEGSPARADGTRQYRAAPVVIRSPMFLADSPDAIEVVDAEAFLYAAIEATLQACVGRRASLGTRTEAARNKLLELPPSLRYQVVEYLASQEFAWAAAEGLGEGEQLCEEDYPF